ncbi:hypothetical protein MAM1_0020c01772 [Mucor ambiguus]|uniref:Uncharacterized protein n=1 Tax=Mucor ambiguus TaxID=91626 RepID=A0A0C9M6G4_9FUNG|nr:hypothetical protein MAM1_0020c01772 [Mucor ambiguus]
MYFLVLGCKQQLLVRPQIIYTTNNIQAQDGNHWGLSAETSVGGDASCLSLTWAYTLDPLLTRALDEYQD